MKPNKRVKKVLYAVLSSERVYKEKTHALWMYSAMKHKGYKIYRLTPITPPRKE